MKVRNFILIIAVILLLTGSSPWEGAAAVAPAGELPAAGFFVATNSFPLNSVVDITNIENGKTTRVIVANTLNTPGLLAIVSREAASLIGMQTGSISRIRMIQPSDPMAYMRFIENAAVGTPMFSTPHVVTNENLEEKLLDDFYREDSYRPPVAAAPLPVQPEPAVPAEITERGYVVDEPEWGGNGRLSIVDIPGFNIEPLPPFENTPGIVQVIEPVPAQNGTQSPVRNGTHQAAEPQPEAAEPWYVVVRDPAPETAQERDPRDVVKDVSQRVNERPSSDIVKDLPLYVYHENDASEINKDVPSYYMADGSRNEVVKEVSEFLAEQAQNEIVKEIPQWVEVIEEEPVYTAEEAREEVTEERPVQIAEETKTNYELVEAEERLPPEPTDYEKLISEIIPSITEAPVQQQPVTPPLVQVVTPPPAAGTFSVPTITRLDSGQYYVQLAAMSADMVENVVRNIDRRYEPKIFRDRDNLYRVLIGPLNQGESAAVLQRFKSIGYKDAFVRRGS